MGFKTGDMRAIVHLVKPRGRPNFYLHSAFPFLASGAPARMTVYGIRANFFGLEGFIEAGVNAVTNRLEDLPPWFRLHPTEICNRFVDKLREKVEQGDCPDEPLDGPNVWRLKSGDRVAWVGPDRGERRSVNGILAVVDCRDCALLIGEGDRGGLEEFVGFGAPTTPEMKPEDVRVCQAAVTVVKQLGVPRTWGSE